MAEPGTPLVLPADLAGIPRGVVGGLIVERAEPARVRVYRERWGRDLDLWWAVGDGLSAAAEGQQPEHQVERLPPWMLSAIKVRLRNHDTYWLGHDFVQVRLLELLGLADFEPDDDYVLSMLTDLVSGADIDGHIWGDPAAWFGDDPALIERGYWRAYTIEGAGLVSLRVNEGNPDGDWRTATCSMIKAGLITREHVIRSCLEALDSDFSPAASGWFIRMLTDLDLNADELDTTQPAIRRHLEHQAPAVVTNALRWLNQLDQHGSIDDEATAPALAAAVRAPTKVTAMAGLRLLDRIRRRTPAADVVDAAAAGLGHRHQDVQRAAARLLLAAGAQTRLTADADLLDTSIQREFDVSPETRQTSTNHHTSTDGESALAGRVAGGPEVVSWQAPTTHDVTERFAALLEHAQDPFELELVLDLLAQTGPTDLLSPLIKRARTVLAENVWYRLEQQLASLVLDSTRSHGGTARPVVPTTPWARFLFRRLTTVRQILQGTALPRRLLATPTAPDGQLDPESFIDRARHTDLADHPTELIAALLRLAPDNRGRALHRWRQNSRPVGPDIDQAIRYALGHDPAPTQQIDDPSLWVAASRSRAPLQDDPLLIGNGLAGAGQGRRLDPTISLSANPDWHGNGWRNHDEERWILQLNQAHPPTTALPTPSHSRRPSPRGNMPSLMDQPTAVGSLSSRHFWDGDSQEILASTWQSWHALTWPADAELYASLILIPTYVSRNWTTPDTDAHEALAALRRHPGRLGPTTAAMIALSMAGGSVDTRVRAVDTVLDLIGRQRLTTDELVAALVVTAPAVVTTRWAETLEQIAVAGRSDITIQALTGVLPAFSQDRRGLHALLDLLHQELLRTNGNATDHALRQHLSEFRGTSQAAKTANAILKL